MIVIAAAATLALRSSRRRAKRKDGPLSMAVLGREDVRAPEPFPTMVAEATGAEKTEAAGDWIDRDATARSERADRRGASGWGFGRLATVLGALRGILLRRPADGAPEASQPSPGLMPEQDMEDDYDVDYGELQRDLGLTERTRGALAIGVISLAVVILIGVWLLGSAHHGPQNPIHFVQLPIQGPQGSVPP
jgi:hypothetical protein